MRTVHKSVLTCAAVLTMVFGVSSALAVRTQSNDHHTIPSPGPTGTNVAAQQTTVLEDNLEVRSWIGLSAPLLDQDGHIVRPAALSCSFLYRHVHIGETHALKAIIGSSHESIHLAVSGLDLGVGDPTLSGDASLRNYQVDLAPKSGMTWESVVDPRQDVVLSVTPLH